MCWGILTTDEANKERLKLNFFIQLLIYSSVSNPFVINFLSNVMLFFQC